MQILLTLLHLLLQIHWTINMEGWILKVSEFKICYYFKFFVYKYRLITLQFFITPHYFLCYYLLLQISIFSKMAAARRDYVSEITLKKESWDVVVRVIQLWFVPDM